MVTSGKAFAVHTLARFAVTDATVVVAVARLCPAHQVKDILGVEVIWLTLSTVTNIWVLT